MLLQIVINHYWFREARDLGTPQVEPGFSALVSDRRLLPQALWFSRYQHLSGSSTTNPR